MNTLLLIVMLFGVILIGVGVFRTRHRYRKDFSRLQGEVDQLRADLESLKSKK